MKKFNVKKFQNIAKFPTVFFLHNKQGLSVAKNTHIQTDDTSRAQVDDRAY